jgi:hypothetical protein
LSVAIGAGKIQIFKIHRLNKGLISGDYMQHWWKAKRPGADAM